LQAAPPRRVSCGRLRKHQQQQPRPRTPGSNGGSRLEDDRQRSLRCAR
jgi:hypothetical protein